MDIETKGSVLLVEDSIVQAAALYDILSPHYTTTVIHNATDGLNKLHRGSFDIIVLDINLPDKSGFDVLVEIKENEYTKNIPVLLITSGNYDGSETRGLELGAADFLLKPIAPKVMLARVNTWIRMSKYIQQLESLTMVDGLTGIANRRNYDIKGVEMFHNAMRLNVPLTIAMFDVDNFKVYNDTYGHTEGDVVLQSVAKILSKMLCRSTDLAARYGGEEFVAVILGGESQQNFDHFCRIRKAVEDLKIKHTPPKQPYVTISIGGITMLPRANEDLAGFLKVADLMLYKAKKLGKDQVVWTNDRGREIHEKE